MTFDVKYNAARICWTRNPPEYNRDEGQMCRSCSAGKKVSFTFEELCKYKSRDHASNYYGDCASIYFRIEGSFLAVYVTYSK